MKKLNRPLIFSLTVLLMTACQDNTVPHATEEAYRIKTIESLNLSHKDNLKLKFGRAFAVAISSPYVGCKRSCPNSGGCH